MLFSLIVTKDYHPFKVAAQAQIPSWVRRLFAETLAIQWGLAMPQFTVSDQRRPRVSCVTCLSSAHGARKKSATLSRNAATKVNVPHCCASATPRTLRLSVGAHDRDLKGSMN